MKLLLSEGTTLKLESYETGIADLDGDSTDGLNLHLVNISLERVKTLFSDESKLAVLEIHSDQNVFMDRFTGYQIRKSITLGEVDDAFTVTLVRGTETKQRVEALRKDFEVLTENVDNALTVFDAVSKQLETLPMTLENMQKIVSEAANLKDTVTQNVSNLAKDVFAMKEVMANVNLVEADRDEHFQEILQKLQEVGDKYTVMQQSLDTISYRFSEMLNLAHNLETSYQAKLNTMDVISEDISQAAASVAETVTEAKETRSAAEMANQALSKFEKKLGDQTQTLEQQTIEIESTREQISGVETRVAALEPITDITTLPLEEAKKQRVYESQWALAEYLETHPVLSDCHGGKLAAYSITAEKQSYLQAMILMASTAQSKGIEYQPSWNAVGEPCTYDWTVDELQQLAIEIERVVRPNVSRQQSIEKDINVCQSMEELLAIEISYESPNDTVEKEDE